LSLMYCHRHCRCVAWYVLLDLIFEQHNDLPYVIRHIHSMAEISAPSSATEMIHSIITAYYQGTSDEAKVAADVLTICAQPPTRTSSSPPTPGRASTLPCFAHPSLTFIGPPAHFPFDVLQTNYAVMLLPMIT